ncbi:MAG: SDR family oxidoreductase [bacterium]|nr:SDR family oxidoreductase [bacterium]
MSRTALITGASGGIGLELARKCAESKMNLVLIARRQEKLEQIASEFSKQYQIQVKIITKDLSKPNAPQEIFDEVQKENININVLINNAGFSNYGQFTTTDINTENDLLQVNIIALTLLTKLFLPPMIKSKFGKILNVGSIASFFPGPLMATYFSSKAYVLSFSQSLAGELQGTGVTVTCLCPGPTQTGFAERAGMHNPVSFGRYSESAEKVAQIGLHGLMRGKQIIVIGFLNNLVIFASRFSPRFLVLKTMKYIQELRK